MSLINKQAAFTQLLSDLAALNESTATTQQLTFLLKNATNAGLNPADIVTELTTRIQSASGSDDLKELILLAVAVSLITTDRIVTVSDLTALNSLTNISPGTIYYVESENVPYILKSDNTWVKVQQLLISNSLSWGTGSNGRLGDGTVISRSSPVSVVGGFTDWVQVSAGFAHSLGVRANGSVWAWGYNAGRLGDGTFIDRSSPVSVVGGFTDWVQVSAGGSHSLAVRADGTAWVWGFNNFGQLGDDTLTTRSSPVSVVGGFTDWVQVSAGGSHSLAVRADGTAWAWGWNYNGQLGDDTLTSRSSPVSVVGGFSDWVQVSASSSRHSLGVRANGSAWAWGNSQFGRLGDNTVIDRSSPVSVVGGFTDWVQVSAASVHNIGVRADGSAWAWGNNISGQLGDDTVIARSSPVSVVGGFTDWAQVSAGVSHSLAVRADGTAWAWGGNVFRLGDGTTIARSSPVSVVGGFTDWVQVSAGGSHNLGIKSSG